MTANGNNTIKGNCEHAACQTSPLNAAKVNFNPNHFDNPNKKHILFVDFGLIFVALENRK